MLNNAKVGESRFTVVHMETDMEVTIITEALTQGSHDGTVHLGTIS